MESKADFFWWLILAHQPSQIHPSWDENDGVVGLHSPSHRMMFFFGLVNIVDGNIHPGRCILKFKIWCFFVLALFFPTTSFPIRSCKTAGSKIADDEFSGKNRWWDRSRRARELSELTTEALISQAEFQMGEDASNMAVQAGRKVNVVKKPWCIDAQRLRQSRRTREESNLQNSLCFKPLGQKDNNASSNGRLVLVMQGPFLQHRKEAEKTSLACKDGSNNFLEMKQ